MTRVSFVTEKEKSFYLLAELRGERVGGSLGDIWTLAFCSYYILCT